MNVSFYGLYYYYYYFYFNTYAYVEVNCKSVMETCTGHQMCDICYTISLLFQFKCVMFKRRRKQIF